MAGSITVDVLSDGSKRYRSRYRDARGRQHEKRFMRKVDAQRWLDEQTSAIVTQTWTAPERGRVTVDVWADQWLAAQTGLKPSTLSSESSSGTGDRRRPRARSIFDAVVGGVGGAVDRRRGGDADRGGGGARRVSGVRTLALRAAACSGDTACSGASRRTG